MKTNVAARVTEVTHEGGRADGHQKPLVELTRAVSTCLLWENTFYEKGSEVGERIAALCGQVTADELSTLAIEARHKMHLRHVPLWLARQLARLHKGPVVGNTIDAVIRRPDEISEFLSLYWKDGGRGPTPKLSAQVKRGLRLAFARFGEYQLAKWNRDGAVKLRDALFLCHAKPKDEEQVGVWKKLIAGELTPPDTWEVALSTGSDKKATWERLLAEGKLGYQALLMNLRNMIQVGVSAPVIRAALKRDDTGREKMFPYRFVAAARYAPQFASTLSDAMIAGLEGVDKLPGETVLVVDVSGSMDQVLSARSEMTRLDAASALAVALREIGEGFRCFTFSNAAVEVPSHRGMGLVEAIRGSQSHQGTYLSQALKVIQKEVPTADRLIVVTDEQSHDGLHEAWTPHSYLINVAPYKPGLDVSQGWTRINGWSDRVVEWIALEEGHARAQVDAADVA